MRQRICLLTAAVLLIPFFVYGYIGRYSRLMADDFCYAVSARDLGFPAVIGYYYENWFGRLTQTVGAIVGAALGVPFAELFPAVLLVLWLIGLLWVGYELGALLKLNDRVIFVGGAGALLYSTLAGTPQIFHSLYWISAVFPYTVPLVLVTYYAALIARALREGQATPLSVIASVALALVAGLSCEPFALAFAGAIAGGILGIFVFRPRPDARRAALILLIAGGITALIALVIMVAAPGNTLRQELFTPTHDPDALAINSLVYTFAVVVVLARTSPPAILLALLLPAVVAYGQPVAPMTRRTLRNRTALAALFAFGLIALTNVPAIYATSTAPPARALIIPQFVLVCAYTVIGWLVGLYARKTGFRLPRLIAIISIAALLVAGPLLSAAQMVALAPRLETYAQEWDSREAQILAAANAGGEALVVAPLSVDVASMTGLDRISTDASTFTNACAADYYGLETLTASS